MGNKLKVFLGGTCNNSLWRDKLIKLLKIDYFNPVVDDWTEDCQKEEIKQRELCDYCLYTITPFMLGVYSIAEVIDDSNKRPDKTLFCILENESSLPNGLANPTNPTTSFTIGALKSLDSVGKMVLRNGGKYFKNLEEVAAFLNSQNMDKL